MGPTLPACTHRVLSRTEALRARIDFSASGLVLAANSMSAFANRGPKDAVPDTTTFETLAMLELIHKSSRKRLENGR